MNPGPVAEKMRAKLMLAFAPILLEIADESARHAGHAGHDGKGESHFRIHMISGAFAGLATVARHRAVYAVLAEEMQGQVHALALDLAAPDQDRQG